MRCASPQRRRAYPPTPVARRRESNQQYIDLQYLQLEKRLGSAFRRDEWDLFILRKPKPGLKTPAREIRIQFVPSGRRHVNCVKKALAQRWAWHGGNTQPPTISTDACSSVLHTGRKL